MLRLTNTQLKRAESGILAKSSAAHEFIPILETSLAVIRDEMAKRDNWPILHLEPRGKGSIYCKACGWCKGGMDSWNGRACKCGHSA